MQDYSDYYSGFTAYTGLLKTKGLNFVIGLFLVYSAASCSQGPGPAGAAGPSGSAAERQRPGAAGAACAVTSVH